MKNVFKYSFFSVVLISLFSLMVYGVMQQMLRLGANDVPLQLSLDTINKLNSGIPAKSVTLPDKIEITKSLSPWVEITDQNKKVIASSATLNGQIPNIPQGVFDSVTQNGEDRVTWQPAAGIRQAVVADKYSSSSVSGFVVTGRSLKETELRIDKIGFDILVGWAVINFFAITYIIFLEISGKR